MDTPERKVTIGIFAGALAAIVCWGTEQFAGITIPVEIGISFSTVLTFGLQYFVPNKETI